MSAAWFFTEYTEMSAGGTLGASWYFVNCSVCKKKKKKTSKNQGTAINEPFAHIRAYQEQSRGSPSPKEKGS